MIIDYPFIHRATGAIGLGLALALGLPACQSGFDKIEDWDAPRPEEASDNIATVQAPKGFGFETSAQATFEVEALHPQTQEPMANVGVTLYTFDKDMREVEVATGVTDDLGLWTPMVTLPKDRDSVTLRVTTMGFATAHRVVVGHAGGVRYTLGAEDNVSGRVMEDATPDDDPSQGRTQGSGSGSNHSPGLTSRAALSYQGSYDKHGRPNYLTTPQTIDDDLLEFIAVNLSESNKVPRDNPHYLDENNVGSVLFRSEGKLEIAFVHEGAGYRNAIGYFAYPIDEPPATIDDIDVRTVAFPNASFRGSGGKMRTGDNVDLGTFPAGTAVGWFLVPNGWHKNSRTVRDKSTTRYSVDALNTFTAEEHRKHVVLLANTARQQLVLGFEDLNRPNGDNDFNDAVFVIKPTPWDAVDISRTPRVILTGDDSDRDGVIDFQDAYPDDPERAFDNYAPGKDSYGTIAYEDMWPRTGDYDFNDLVVDYTYTETVDARGWVKDLVMDFRVRAIGASQNHGFAVRLPVDPRLVESVTGQSIHDRYIVMDANGTESGHNEAVIPVFDNGFALFDQTRGIINTDPTLEELEPGKVSLKITFARPVDRTTLGPAPYDAFMIRSQDRQREIHLAGYAPTAMADMSYFNTQADRSDLDAKFYYVDKHNLPWAITIPEDFRYPREKKRIDELYPNFNAWATYGGTTQENWYRNLSGNVNGQNGF